MRAVFTWRLRDSCVPWAPSERVETVSEVRELVPVWPGLADVLQTCEVPSFSGDDIPQGQPSHEAVTNVLTMAVEAVNV